METSMDFRDIAAGFGLACALMTGSTIGAGINSDGGLAISTAPTFSDLDTNLDGTVTREEAQQKRPDLIQHWQEADRDKDGKIDRGEFAAFEVNQESPPIKGEEQPMARDGGGKAAADSSSRVR
jgi:EF hand